MTLDSALKYTKTAMIPLLYTEDAKAWGHAKKNGTIPVMQDR